MNKRVNRLLSLAICLAMVITMLPLAVFAADTTPSTLTVFCQADDWTNCNAYWWGSSVTNPGWPGEAMSQDEAGIWYYDIPADATNVIFNNGSAQTADLKVPTDENVMFVVGPNEWTAYGRVEVEKSFYVAGSFNGWNAAADGYQMIKNADGTYALSVILPKGEHQLKVTDGSWTNAWGDGGNNVTFNVSAEGEVTITFDPSSCLVTVSGDCLGEGEPLTITSVHLVASEGLLANAWTPSENQMNSAMGVYSLTVENVAAGTYEYKFAANSGWDLSWGAGLETVSGESYPVNRGGENNKLTVDVDGSTVTFTFDMTTMDIVTGEGATCSVTIEAPAFEGIPLTLGDNTLNLAVGDVDGDIWTYTATEDGTLSINLTALATDQDGSGTLVDVDPNFVTMAFVRNYSFLVNEQPSYEFPTTVAVKAGDKVNIHIYSGMGTTTRLTLNLAMGEAQEEVPAEPGTTADNPIAIETLPYEITAEGEHDLYYTYTAAEDCTLVITTPAGNYVSGLVNYTKDEETGTYYEIVTAGQVVSLNPWGSNSGTYTITMQESTPEVVVEYYAAGDFNSWNEKNDSYKLTADENGVYSLTVTLAKGNYGMKITDGTWDNSWGDNGNNVTFIVDNEGEVTISFDPVTCIVTVSGDCLGQPDPLTITSLHVVGAAELTGADWKPEKNQMTSAMGVYTITFTDVAAGTYDYKFAANGNWDLSWGNGGQTVTGETYPLYVNGGNNKLTVDVDGSTVTFTFDMTAMDIFTGEGATCTAVVEAPAAEPSVAPTVTLQYPTVSFEDVIVLNVYYAASELDDVVEMGLVTFSEKLENANINDAQTVVPGYTWSESDGFYFSSTKGIAAKDLGDTVYFAIYAQLSDGTYSYTKIYSYSPKTYAYNQLRNGKEEAMRPLVVAMLNYGAAAQTYFNYNTDALVNADLTDEEKGLVAAYNESMIHAVPLPDDAKKGEMIGNGGYAKRYPTISFEGAFCINYYFAPSATPAGEVTMYVWNQADYNAATSLSKDNASKAITMTLGDNGEYAAVVDGIAAKDLDSGVYVAFCYSDGTTDYCSGVIGYSIGVYCKNQASKTGAMADLAAATAVYGHYAQQVFGA